ncbi:mitochondrial carrier [Colletotrichum falcatum]|nr:mitochondrial carrier [Colletotrichum falcatum]
MSLSPGSEISLAAAIAALGADVLVHPIDTLITRTQSPGYGTHYKNPSGSFNRSLFLGLYQGFGPTLVVGMPASAAFFTIYEGLKKASQDTKAAGHLQGVPLPVLHGASSAAADLVACAIINPAEVLKQNAQVHKQDEGSAGRQSPTLKMLKMFIKQPSRLWAGYAALATSSIPGISLTFLLYESLAAKWLRRLEQKSGREKASMAQQIRVHTASAGLAGAAASLLFVPVDVVKTRMMLAAGGHASIPHLFPTSMKTQGSAARRSEHARPRAAHGPLRVAREVFRAEGVRGLFRGGGLTCLAAAVGSGIGLGSYEGFKQYLRGSPQAQEEALL